jgi:hypothetical protein
LIAFCINLGTTDLIPVKLDHLSGRAVYKMDLFVPFIKEKEMDEVSTEFSMEKLMAMWYAHPQHFQRAFK